MNHQEKLNFIREKCIAANPEIDMTSECNGNCRKRHYRTIRLADILFVVTQRPIKKGEAINDSPRWKNDIVDIVFMWNLRNDDIEKQSEETITFLAELLK